MKYFEIQNHSIFKNTLLSLGEPKEVAQRIRVHPSTVSSWTTQDRPRVTSDNIKKLLDQFKLTPEELGVVEKDDGIEETSIAGRLTELMKETGVDGKKLAKELNIAESTLSNIKNGKYSPGKDILKSLASYFNVNTLYLQGETNIRSADNYEIRQILNLGEQALENLKSDCPDETVDFMGQPFMREDLGEKYYDLKDNIINSHLLFVLKEEIDRVVEWYLDYNNYSTFENVINEREILGQSVSFVHNCTAKDIAHLNIHRELDKVFDEYIRTILQQRGLTNADIDSPYKYHLDSKLRKQK